MARDVTALIARWNAGDDDAGRQVMERLYGEVRRIAGNVFQQERPGHTLQPTAIVHDSDSGLKTRCRMASVVRSAHRFAAVRVVKVSETRG